MSCASARRRFRDAPQLVARGREAGVRRHASSAGSFQRAGVHDAAEHDREQLFVAQSGGAGALQRGRS
jgi:hypothetical protein